MRPRFRRSARTATPCEATLLSCYRMCALPGCTDTRATAVPAVSRTGRTPPERTGACATPAPRGAQRGLSIRSWPPRAPRVASLSCLARPELPWATSAVTTSTAAADGLGGAGQPGGDRRGTRGFAAEREAWDAVRCRGLGSPYCRAPGAGVLATSAGPAAEGGREVECAPFQMNAEERNRLKKLGKQIAEQRSRELQGRLHDANPAPAGSDEWVKNYKAATSRERQLRAEQPDRIAAATAARDFILEPVDPAPLGVPTWYIQCPQCGDLLHTVPRRTTRCSCGAVELDAQTRRVLVQHSKQPRWVKLMGRARGSTSQGRKC